MDGTLLHPKDKLIEAGYEILPAPPEIWSQAPLFPLTHLTSPQEAYNIVILRYCPPQNPKNPKSEGPIDRPCFEFPSLTSGSGFMSFKTVELVGAIRGVGGGDKARRPCEFVILTGARSKTYVSRRKVGLPVVDFESIEGGGRMSHGGTFSMEKFTLGGGGGKHKVGGEDDQASPSPLCWDPAWDQEIGVIDRGEEGVIETEIEGEGKIEKEVGERAGLLWDTYRELQAWGWVKVDARFYSTSFRADVSRADEDPKFAAQVPNYI